MSNFTLGPQGAHQGGPVPSYFIPTLTQHPHQLQQRNAYFQAQGQGSQPNRNPRWPGFGPQLPRGPSAQAYQAIRGTRGPGAVSSGQGARPSALANNANSAGSRPITGSAQAVSQSVASRGAPRGPGQSALVRPGAPQAAGHKFNPAMRNQTGVAPVLQVILSCN